jgi:hypothetical protein
VSRSAIAVLVALAATGSLRHAGADDGVRARSVAIRTGWAYGLGLEVEYRPRSWGIGASGGYVPGLGPGGYLGIVWGLRPLTRSGWVAEAGAFRGVHNPFRVARSGFGAYALAGYAVAHAERLSVRAVAGGGFPLDDPDHLGSFEILAKLTVGVVF